MIIKEHYVQFCGNELENQEKLDDFLEKYNFLKLLQAATKNWNWSSTIKKIRGLKSTHNKTELKKIFFNTAKPRCFYVGYTK